MPLENHAGAEHVPVQIDHALAVPAKRALALQLLVEEVDILLVMVRDLGIGHRNVLGAFQPQLLDRLADAVLAADENRLAIACVAERHRRADDFLFLALGKDHAFAVGADAVENHLQGRCRRVETGRQVPPVSLQILDRLAGNAAVHRRGGNRG